MESITLVQGEDKIIKIPLFDINGGAIDLSAATEIVAGLMVNNKLQSKFSLQHKDNYGSILVGGTNNNEIQILARRNVTKDYAIGVLKAVILVETPDDDLNNKRTEYTFSLGNTVKGNLADEIMTIYTPGAPTLPVVDDVNNTFDWTSVVGFTSAEDYEISVDGGVNWLNVSAKPYSVGNVAIASGDVQVRVQANPATDVAAGAILVSDAPFTQS